MFTVEVRTGKLIEARIRSLATKERAIAYAQALARAAEGGTDRVLVADHRPVVIYSQPVADTLASLFAKMNSKLLRVAIVAGRSNATLWMQLGRIVREAQNPSRQMFDDPAAAQTFLAADLSAAEQSRLAVFLQG